jgi:glycosyltransferase involved in cell wall biosynthesis
MDISVVVPTLNARDQLAGCLDALTEYVPDAEVVVVNGPSADGTTGMVQDRDDVSVLVEVADRNLNAARNAGINNTSGDVVGLVSQRLTVTETWTDAVEEGIEDVDVVTGPTHTELSAGIETEQKEARTIAGREVTYLNGGNAAFRREVLDELDGFDEYLDIGGTRDMAHRLTALDFSVRWDEEMCARREVGADGGETETDWGWKYRSLSYRLVKNYGFRPTVIRRILGHAGSDAVAELRMVVGGEGRPSQWLGTGREVLSNTVGGTKDGLLARRLDRTVRRNPRGRSSRADRPVTVYDWR